MLDFCQSADHRNSIQCMNLLYSDTMTTKDFCSILLIKGPVFTIRLQASILVIISFYINLLYKIIENMKKSIQVDFITTVTCTTVTPVYQEK